jgi:hypothetical protein
MSKTLELTNKQPTAVTAKTIFLGPERRVGAVEKRGLS